MFLGRFWTSPGLTIFFSGNVARKVDETCNIAWVLGTICVASKSLWIPHLFISREIQNCLEMKVKSIHILLPSHLTYFQWPPMSLGGIPWRPELGLREISKACIITFNFGCFLDMFVLLRAWSYFPETFLGKPTWLIMLRWCLALFVLPRKASKYPICSFLVKSKTAPKWT